MEGKKKRNNKKGLVSLILLFISFSLFVTSTFAWFTDTATVKGNKVFAGNLYVDVVASDEELANIGYVVAPDAGETVQAGGTTEEGGLYKATYDLSSGEVDTYISAVTDAEGNVIHPIKHTHEVTGTGSDIKDYYIMTDVEAPIVSIYNVEPGQAYVIELSVLNSGDLAIKYSAGFDVSKDEEGNPRSYTGLETLEKQHEGTFDTYHNKYLAGTGTIDNNRPDPDYTLNTSLTGDEGSDGYKEYMRRKAKLERMQTNADGEDIGGHLEDALVVYAVDDDSIVNGSVTRAAIKESNYIGTVRQVMNLADYTYSVDSDPAFTTDEERAAAQVELDAVRVRMNSLSTGYCLPQETIDSDTSEDGVQLVDNDGVTVNIYNQNNGITGGDAVSEDLIGTRENVSEIDKIKYIIMMPETADNRYQNASIFLDIGVTATQVEFEYDGMNYMLYDSNYSPYHVGDLLGIAYNGTGAVNGYIDAVILESLGDDKYAVLPKSGFDSSNLRDDLLSSGDVDYFKHHVKYMSSNGFNGVNGAYIASNALAPAKVNGTDASSFGGKYFAMLTDDATFTDASHVSNVSTYSLGYLDLVKLKGAGLNFNATKDMLKALGYTGEIAIDTVKLADAITSGTPTIDAANIDKFFNITINPNDSGSNPYQLEIGTPNDTNDTWSTINLNEGGLNAYIVDLSDPSSFIVRGVFDSNADLFNLE